MLLFHETFQPELTYVSKILALAADDFIGDKYNISEVTGIPTGKEKGKVEPHIKYAKYMGLIDYTYDRGIYNLSLLPLGQEVWKQDKYLHENITLWLLHYGLSREEYGAPQWTYFVKTANSGFTNDVSTEYFFSNIQKDMGVSLSDATKAFGVVKSSYSDGLFSGLYFAEWDDEHIHFNEKNEQYDMTYLYGYALLDCWDRIFSDKKELSFDQVVEDMSYGKIFGLNSEEIDSVLCSLEEKQIVSINRQLFPVTIVRTIQTQDIIAQIYSQLM